MLKTMREKTKIIIWVTVVAFIVSLFFVFGDAIRKKVKDRGVARVGKDEISVQEFNEIYQRILNNQDIPETEYPEIQTARIMEQAFHVVVENKILKMLSEKSDVKVTDMEIVSDIQSIPAFRGPQGFDKNRYEQFLYNQGYTPKVFEQLYREDLLMQRMKYMILDFYSLSHLEIMYLYKVSNNKGIAEFINFDLEDFYEKVEYTEQDLMAYYEKHKQNYFVPRQIKVRFFNIPIIASEEDEKEVRARLEEIRKRAVDGEDFSALAKANSEGPSAENGGDLGWIEKGRTVKSFEEAAFALKNGEVSGIVKTQFGLHIIKKEDEKKENGKTLIKCRHILLKVEPSDFTKDQTHESADKLAELLKTTDNFDEIKKQYPDAFTQETDYFTENRPPIPQLAEAFKLGPDEKVDIPIPLKNSFLVYKITDVKPEYHTAFEKVKDEIEQNYLKEESVPFARETAEKVYKEIKEKGKDFNLKDYCQENNLNYLKSAEFVSGSPIKYQIESSTEPVNLNESNEFSRDLYLTEDYKITGPFKYANGFVIGRMINRNPIEIKDAFSMDIEYFGRYMKQVFQREFFMEWMEYNKNKFSVESFWNVKAINLKNPQDIEKVKSIMAGADSEKEPVVEQETVDTSYVILNHLPENTADEILEQFKDTKFKVFKELEINI